MEYTFRNNGIVSIVGPNGSGKSSFIDILPYTLFGSTTKGNHGDDVVNNKVNKNCHTWTEFKIDDVNYRIDRYHKHTKFGNTVHLYKEKQLIKNGQKEVKPEIER